MNKLWNKRGTVGLLGLVTVGALGFGLAGCTAPAAVEGDTGLAELSNLSECVTTAETAVEKHRAPLELLTPDSPLDTDSLAGLDIWFIQTYMNQFAFDFVEGLTEAADHVGATVTTLDPEGSVDAMNEGLAQAVARGADAIILSGIDPALVAATMSDVEKAGIPVLDFVSAPERDEIPPGYFAQLTSDWAKEGEMTADWILADSGCTSNTTIVLSSTLPIWNSLVGGAESRFEELCSSCKVQLVDADLANLATDVPQQLQVALQREPDTSYVFTAWDSALPLIAPITASADGVKIASRDGLAFALDMIAAEDGLDADVASAPLQWQGWIAFDMIARQITGAEVPDYVIPARLADASNIGDGSIDHLFPEYADFQAAFISAWEG